MKAIFKKIFNRIFSQDPKVAWVNLKWSLAGAGLTLFLYYLHINCR